MKPEIEAKRAMALTLGFDAIAAFFSMFVAVYARWIATSGAPNSALLTAAAASAAFALAAII